MKETLTYSVKKIGQSQLGGLGFSARYLREIEVHSTDDNKTPGRFSGWQVLCHELLEDGGDYDHLVTLFDASSDLRKLCKAIYGCFPLELDHHLKSTVKPLYGPEMASCLSKVGASQAEMHSVGLDCLLVTEFLAEPMDLQSPSARQLAQGLRYFFKDAEYIIVAANKLAFECSSIEDNQRSRAAHVSGWSAMGFEQIGMSDYMLCQTSKLCINT